MEDLILCWDNGITGSYTCLSMIDDNEIYYSTIPVKHEKNYTKKTQYINRVDNQKLYRDLKKIIGNRTCKVYMERPMINGGRFMSTMSAIRCLESELICIENLGLESPIFIDSKEWQRNLLVGIKGREQLKMESMHLGQKLFPSFYKEIQKQKDADSFLIAHYIKQKILNSKEV